MSEQVLAAINALYHNDDSNVKQQANTWLEHWQASETAWMQADALLHNQATPVDALWFCAQTLRTKVQRDFHQLPATAIGSLRESLMNLLLTHAQGHPPVRTQLCLAIAALGVHMEKSNWGEKGIVAWLATALTRAPQEVAQPCMLELLHVLPQEAGSHKLAVRPARRREFIAELGGVVGDALEVLSSCMGHTWREGVLEAFCSWLRLCGSALPGALLTQHPLVRFTLEALNSPDCFEKSVDVMCELIYLTVDLDNGGGIKPDMLPLVHLMFPAVMQLRPRFVVARQRADAASEGKEDDVADDWDDDEETVKGMARLFAEVGEAYAPFIAQGSPEAAGPVEALLEVTAYPDPSISSMALNFWSRLTRQLLPNHGTPPAEPQRLATFAPAYERLVGIIRIRSRYPENWITLSKAEQRDFKRARREMGDAVLYASEVLGAERAVALVGAFLEEARGEMAHGGVLPWRVVEAGLFCTGALRQTAIPPGHPLLLQTLSALSEHFSGDPLLATPSTHLISDYAPWLSRTIEAGTPGAPQLLSALLQLSIKHLGSSDSAGSAAKCVLRLCEECGRHMGACLEALVKVYEQVLAGGATRLLTGEADGGDGVLEQDVLLIIQGVTHAVCSCSAPDQLVAAVGYLVNPLVARIQEGLQRVADAADTGEALSTQHPFLLPQFDRLAALIQSIPQPHVVAQLLGSCWPLLDTALGHAGRDERSVERLLRVLRLGLKHAGKLAAPMLPLLLEVLPQGFQRTSIPAFMYVVSELVKVFGDDPATDASLGPIVQQLLAAACTQLPSLQQHSAAPDLVDDTFILAARALHYCPRLILDPRLLPPLLDTTLVGLLVEHREACGSVMACLCRLLDPVIVESCTANRAAVQQLLQDTLTPRGPHLVKLLLAGAAGAQPSARVPELCDVFIALLKRTPEAAVAWLVEAAKGLPSPAVQQQDVERLVGAASAVARGGGVADERSLEDALYELGEVANLTAASREACLRALLPPQLVVEVLRLPQ